jgi:hypothetical protein
MELVNERKPKGTHLCTFDVSNLAAGVYYYTMHVKGFSSTRKVVVER